MQNGGAHPKHTRGWNAAVGGVWAPDYNVEDFTFWDGRGAGILPANCRHARPGSHGGTFARASRKQLSGPAWQANRSGAGVVCYFTGGPGCHRFRGRLRGAPLPDCGAAEPFWHGHSTPLLRGATEERQNGVSLSGSPAGNLRELAIPPLQHGAMLVPQAPSRKAHRYLIPEQMKTAEDANDAGERIV